MNGSSSTAPRTRWTMRPRRRSLNSAVDVSHRNTAIHRFRRGGGGDFVGGLPAELVARGVSGWGLFADDFGEGGGCYSAHRAAGVPRRVLAVVQRLCDDLSERGGAGGGGLGRKFQLDLLPGCLGISLHRLNRHIAISRFHPGNARLRRSHAGGDLGLGKPRFAAGGDERLDHLKLRFERLVVRRDFGVGEQLFAKVRIAFISMFTFLSNACRLGFLP